MTRAAVERVRSMSVDGPIVAALVLLAAALRLIGIDSQSLWLDEIGEATTSRMPLPDLFAAVKGDAAATPLDFFGIRLVTQILGTDTTATRLWSLAVGSLAVGLVYFAARRMFRARPAAVLAAMVLVTSPFAIFYAQEARFYSLAMLVSALSVLTFQRAWEKGGAGAWLAFAGASTLVLYTHYFAAGVLLSTQAVFAAAVSIAGWLRRGRTREELRRGVRRVGACAAAMLIAMAAFTPWLVYATLPQLGRVYQGTPPPPFDVTFIGGVVADLFSGLAWPRSVWLIGVLVLAVAVGVIRAIVHGRADVAFILAATMIAVPIAWLADSRVNYGWATRQVAFILPLACILAGGGLWSFGQGALAIVRVSRGSRVGQAAVVVALGVGLLLLSWTSIARVHRGELAKDDWRGVTRLLTETACPDATFHVNVAGNYQFGIGYYNPSLSARSQFLPPGPRTIAESATSLPLGQHDWLIVLTYLSSTGDVDTLSSRMAAAGWTEHVFTSIRAYGRGAGCST